MGLSHLIRTCHPFVTRLQDDELYCGASIVRFAEEAGLLDIGCPNQMKQRLRIALDRLAMKSGFPSEGDGTIMLADALPVAAWYGCRWKGAVQDTDGTED